MKPQPSLLILPIPESPEETESELLYESKRSPTKKKSTTFQTNNSQTNQKHHEHQQHHGPNRILDWVHKLERINAAPDSSGISHSHEQQVAGSRSHSVGGCDRDESIDSALTRASICGLTPAAAAIVGVSLTEDLIINKHSKNISNNNDYQQDEEEDLCFKAAQLVTEFLLMLFAAALLIIVAIVIVSKRTPTFMDSYDIVPKILFFLCVFVASYSLLRWIIIKVEPRLHSCIACIMKCCPSSMLKRSRGGSSSISSSIARGCRTKSVKISEATKSRFRRQKQFRDHPQGVNASSFEDNHQDSTSSPSKVSEQQQQLLGQPLTSSASCTIGNPKVSTLTLQQPAADANLSNIEHGQQQQQQQHQHQYHQTRQQRQQKQSVRFMQSRLSCPGPQMRQIAFDQHTNQNQSKQNSLDHKKDMIHGNSGYSDVSLSESPTNKDDIINEEFERFNIHVAGSPT